MGRLEQYRQAVADIRIGKEFDLNFAVLIVFNGNVTQSAADTDLCKLILEGEGISRQFQNCRLISVLDQSVKHSAPPYY